MAVAVPSVFRLITGRFFASLVANLHVIMAIRNTEFFEVLLPDAMQKYGLAEEITVDRDGLVHAPTEPGLGANIDFELIERKKSWDLDLSVSCGEIASLRSQ